MTTGRASPGDVARAHARRLAALRRAADPEVRSRTAAVAGAVHEGIRRHLDGHAKTLGQVLTEIDPSARGSTTAARPGEAGGEFWRSQLFRTADTSGVRVNLADGSWWVRLDLVARGLGLRFVAAVQKVGAGERGMLTVSVFAELFRVESPPGEPGGNGVRPWYALPPDARNLVEFGVDDPAASCWVGVEVLLERSLAAAVDAFGDWLPTDPWPPA